MNICDIILGKSIAIEQFRLQESTKKYKIIEHKSKHPLRKMGTPTPDTVLVALIRDKQ
jgi:hypothetical protein